MTGPLTPFADHYAFELSERGYTARTAVNQLRQLGRLSHWLEAGGLGATELRRETIAELRAAGLTQAQVAEVLGVSPGRISQLEPSPGTSPKDTHVVVERAIPTEPGIRASRSLYLSETEHQGVTPSRQMLKVGPEPAAAHIAARLGVAEGDDVVVRRKLMSANGIPIRISGSYFLPAFAEETGLDQADFIEEGYQVLFERHGRRFGHAVETLTGRMPTPDEAQTLQLAADVPVVHVLRTSYDVNKEHIHTLESVCAADKHVFRVRQPDGTDAF